MVLRAGRSQYILSYSDICEKEVGLVENHSVTIENRETLTVTDIKEIDSFDELRW